MFRTQGGSCWPKSKAPEAPVLEQSIVLENTIDHREGHLSIGHCAGFDDTGGAGRGGAERPVHNERRGPFKDKEPIGQLQQVS